MKAHPVSPALLAGPTAVGKSAVALLLAERLDGEIISVDSMQVYRGLDIGTAKPSAEDRRRVPHHLIDVAELDEPFDAARFVEAAGEAIAAIRARGRLPILCGGTGLYFRAYREGLGGAPASSPALRALLEATPLDDLLRELEEHDPMTYARIDRQNPRRVIRAIQVIRLTGRPFSSQRADWSASPAESAAAFGLSREPEDLRRRIDARVDAMFAQGLVAETQRLRDRGLEGNPTASLALGYRQVLDHLRGERSLPETIALVKTRTWQYARRQLTWFRRQARLTWFELRSDESAEAAAARVLAAWPSSPGG